MYFNDFILESSCWLIPCHGRVLFDKVDAMCKMRCKATNLVTAAFRIFLL